MSDWREQNEIIRLRAEPEDLREAASAVLDAWAGLAPESRGLLHAAENDLREVLSAGAGPYPV